MNPDPGYRRPPPNPARDRSRKLLITGAVMIAVAAVIAACPAVVPIGNFGKYIVLLGVLTGCAGASILIHGTWDWLRDRPR